MRAIERRLRFPLPVKKLRDTQRDRDAACETVSHSLQDIKSSETMILISFMCLLLAAAVNPAQSQEIHEIKSDGVVILCSGGVAGTVKWVKDKNDIAGQTNATLEVKAEQGRVEGFYSCTYGDITHVFYLRVKVCENCYELSRLKATALIFGNLLITGLVILIVFIFANKNSGGTHKRASNLRSENPPQPPNPDYAPLDPKTRNNAVYSGIR
ncbi:T-cell surface glycoprotein CD3 epsilon chain-like [Sinocyclocheilus anshuiensis]|uniref:T-cell surface glycoprotein CD3 epsilon chain-like n=2 Tax=Sinocyclocheilus anshuiensis TaxID=1608454 RepID=UPI0007B7EC92|nr:PREDICTED: T-cell surface glycoprotein CD3 epsilon chain-like [Sinocyclocheilus anshuiensis]